MSLPWLSFDAALSRAEAMDLGHRGHSGYTQLRQSWLSQKYNKALCGEELREIGSRKKLKLKVVDLVAIREETGELALIEIKFCPEKGGKASSLGQISAKVIGTLRKLLEHQEVPSKIVLYVVIPEGFKELVLNELWSRWSFLIRETLAEELGERYKYRPLELRAELTLLESQPPYIYKVILYDTERRAKLKVRDFPLRIIVDDKEFRIVDIYIVEVKRHDSSG